MIEAHLKSVFDVQTRARQLCDDANAFFGHSYTQMHSVPRDELAALQLAGLQYRLDELRNRIPILQKLADKQGIDELGELDDVVALLFEHTMYKSYPPALLEKNQFAQIMRWMAKLVAIDLSHIDVSECRSIDDWLQLMDRESDLAILHSSGTSGTMSFIPCSKREWDKFGVSQKIQLLQKFGEPHDPHADGAELHAIYPFFRSGSSVHLRNIDNIVKHILGSEDRLIVAYPERMSSDVLYLAARIRAAKAKGELQRLKISPELLARKSHYERLQAEMPARLAKFFEDVVDRLAGKRVMVVGTWNILLDMATAGLAKGLKKVFSPDSLILGGGGAKGMERPANWEDDVSAFTGVDAVIDVYGMTEVRGSALKCEQGHYHFPPWVIPFLLDPQTSKALPRAGVVTGRASFYDLGAETRWGGFISGDEITINWDDRCPCGRESVFMLGNVERYSEKNSGDDKISCAATESAHREAMSFLTKFE
jgi:hypothetical protein